MHAVHLPHLDLNPLRRLGLSLRVFVVLMTGLVSSRAGTQAAAAEGERTSKTALASTTTPAAKIPSGTPAETGTTPAAPISLTYELLNKHPSDATDSLRFREAAGFVKAALAPKGLHEALPRTKPDIILELTYGTNPPVFRNDIHSSFSIDSGRIEYELETVVIGSDASGQPVYQQVMRPHVPKTPSIRPAPDVVVYETYLRLSARPPETAPGDKPAAPLWGVDIACECSVHGFREHLPDFVLLCRNVVQKAVREKTTVKIQGYYRNGRRIVKVD